MKLTQQEYNELIRAHPNLKPQDSPLRPSKQEQPKGSPLERPTQRKDKGGPRFEICFRIASQRPLDWDNPWTKAMQDLLVRVGILHDDNWRILQGRVITQKANSKEEECTIIDLSSVLENNKIES